MKSLYCSIVFVIAFSQFAYAQSVASSGPQVQLNHIAVYVHDLGKSTAFYEEVLGLSQIPEPFKDGRHTWFSLGAAGQLHLIQGAAEGKVYDKNSHLCFSVPSIEVFIENLDRHKIARENWVGDSREPNVRVDGIRQIYFQDPDGYWIEVNNDFSS